MKRAATEAYLDMRLGSLSNRGLTKIAERLLTEDDTPEWALRIAALYPDQVLEAEGILTDSLLCQKILPDSRQLRKCVRDRVLRIADRLAPLDEKGLLVAVREIEQLLKILPGYEFGSLSIPIVEFPYPPSQVQTAAELEDYVRGHIDQIVRL